MLHNLADSILNVKKQHTLGKVVEFGGIALHSGGNVNLKILPAISIKTLSISITS